MELFELNYKIYTSNKNNIDDFIVDFDMIWNWIGFSTKGNAKKLLVREFEINVDYIMNTPKLIQMDKRIKGGINEEKIKLTIECFKTFCFTAATIQSKKIYKYYIKMEDIITKYIENKHNEIIENNNKIVNETTTLLKLKDIEIQNNKHIINEKDQEIETNKKLLQLKDLEIESF